jgi:hypothetical protein
MTIKKITPSLYDLSNDHFENVEVVTKGNISIKGQFVKFKVVEDDIEYLYPSEKYCFLPEENKKQFWKIYQSNNGEFRELPIYIKQLGLK